MELLLNAIWLAVATSLLVVWRLRWLPQLREGLLRNRRRQSFVGLICVLALLFPAISLTDDLHPSVIALTDTKSVYAVAHSPDSAGPSPQSLSPLQGFAGIVGVWRSYFALAQHDSPVVFARLFTLHESRYGRISGRAPPSFS
jgi:hypothetical protein